MNGKRMISGVLAVMTFLMTASPASLPFDVLAADGESVEQESLYTLGTSLCDEVIINNETFPDETFRSYVSENFDTDKSGGLSEEEIKRVTTISISGTEDKPNNIRSLKGIEFFTDLMELYCGYNELTELDVSHNAALTHLNCYMNHLTSLDLSSNTELILLSCFGNELTSLDVSKNTDLNYFYCTDNSYAIDSADGKYCLKSLPIGFDPTKASDWSGAEYDSSTNSLYNITSAYITYTYDCGNNNSCKFTLVDNTVPDITVTFDDKLSVYSTGLSQFIKSGSSVKSGSEFYIGTELQDYVDHKVLVNGREVSLYPNGDVYFCVRTYTADSEDIKISLEESKWSDERMSDYTVLNADEGIRVYWYNKYTGYIVNYPNTIANGSYIPKDAQVCIRISSELYPNMPKLYINGHFQATSMNMGKDWQIWGLYVPDDDVFRITIDGMVSDEPVAEINENTFPDDAFRAEVKSKADLNGDNKLTENEILQTEYLTICGTDDEPGSIKSLKGIEYFTELKFLDCCNNEIEDIDVSVFPKLYFLSCGNNNLESLDVSKNPYLTQLYCSGNKLTEIDVSANKSLERLACADNLLTSLDVSSNTVLTWLYCSVNKLTELDLSHNPKLVTLGVNENCLTSLDLSENQLITEYDDKGNKAQISLTNGSFPLTALKGFDPTRASNWQGAEYDESKNALKNFTSDTVTYSYDCGNGHSMEFTLVCTAVTVSDIIVTDSSVTVRYSDNSSATYAFNEVPTELVDEMDTQSAADFVNAFTGTSVGEIILTDAELKAIEKGLEKDYIQ